MKWGKSLKGQVENKGTMAEQVDKGTWKRGGSWHCVLVRDGRNGCMAVCNQRRHRGESCF